MVIPGIAGQGPPLVYVEDIASFISATLTVQTTPFEIFNLSSPERLSWEEIISELSRHMELEVRIVRVPFPVVYGIGSVLEFLWKVARARRPPPVTRFAAALVGVQYYFDATRALTVRGFPGFTSFSKALDETFPQLEENLTLPA